jgi:hypothetical protein
VKFTKHYILDLIRFYYHLFCTERVKANFKRYKLSKNKKTTKVIKRELKELKAYWGFIPDQYYTFDFYSLDCQLTMKEMKQYIPSYYFYKIIFPYYDNVKKIIPMIENKVSMNNLFKELGLPQSNVIFIKNNIGITNFNQNTLIEKRLEEILFSTPNQNLFIKTVCGKGGKGIIIAHKLGNDYYIDEDKITYSFLNQLIGDYVVETSIEQHSYINSVYSESVNTLRAVTVRNKQGEITLIAATLRMGVEGSQIDNGSAGGLLIGINLSNGKCLKPYATYEYGLEKFDEHPDSGFDFSLLKIPNWDKVKLEIELSAKKLTQMNLVGWDIAITQNGIVIIEANTLFGLDHSQAGVGGIKDFFVEGNPNNYLFL